MDKVEQLKEDALKQIDKLRKDLKLWESILATISASEIGNVLNSVSIQTHNTGQVNSALNNNLQQLPIKSGTYSANLPFEDKALHFAKIHNKAFSKGELTDFILGQEGPEVAEATLKNISQKLISICRGRFIAAKFDDVNKYKYYLLNEWRSEDGTDMKPEHYPTARAFGSLALDRRNSQHIKFITKG